MADTKPKSTTTAKKPATKKPAVEPQFETLAAQLAVAEQKAKAVSADASQARAERQHVAVNTIKAAFAEKVPGADIRRTLLGAGVLKGTVSKIVTVIDALNDGVLRPDDVKSLNGAYNLVKQAEKARIAAASGGGAPPAGATGTPTTPAEPAKPVTPDDALQIILDSIKNAGSDDAIFKAAGDWITKITDAISAITKSVGSEEE